MDIMFTSFKKPKEIPICLKKKMIAYGREAADVFSYFKHHYKFYAVKDKPR